MIADQRTSRFVCEYKYMSVYLWSQRQHTPKHSETRHRNVTSSLRMHMAEEERIIILKRQQIIF